MRIDATGKTSFREPVPGADHLEAFARAIASKRGTGATDFDTPALIPVLPDFSGASVQGPQSTGEAGRSPLQTGAEAVGRSAPLRSGASTASRAPVEFRLFGSLMPGGDTVMQALSRGKEFVFGAADRVQSTVGTAWDAGQRAVDAVVENPQLLQRHIDSMTAVVNWMSAAGNSTAEASMTTAASPPAPSIPVAPRTIEEVRSADALAAGGAASGEGELGQKFTARCALRLVPSAPAICSSVRRLSSARWPTRRWVRKFKMTSLKSSNTTMANTPSCCLASST